ncbi:hypothetical protein Bca101_020788 [Brassica carinata]
MGIIETGTVSGNLPRYPSSISRALETPGGIQGITTARESTSNKLELHFRPEDPYAHPAWGERRPCNGFLLRIYKEEDVKRGSSLPEAQPVVATGDACPALCADVVARVSDGMADYQHVIPIHADVAQQRKRKCMVVNPLAGNDDLMDMADEDVMMLLPQFFAPKDMPDNLVHRLPGTSGSKKKEEAPTQNLCEDDIGPVFAIDFSVKDILFSIPKVLNWEDFIVPTSNQWQWQVAVSALFDERPVWTRDSIVQRLLDKGLKCTHHMLNRCLRPKTLDDQGPHALINGLGYTRIVHCNQPHLHLATKLLNMGKEALEDWRRFMQDVAVKSRKACVHKGRGRRSASGMCYDDGICYVETNLKVKRCLDATLALEKDESFNSFSGIIKCEDLNPNLYTFVGNLECGGQVYPLDPNQILLRDSKLRNTTLNKNY